MELIDREQLLERAKQTAYYFAIKGILTEIPTVEAVLVVHGRWVKHKKITGFVYCSVCEDVYIDAAWLADGKWGYCPNCGARMDVPNLDTEGGAT